MLPIRRRRTGVSAPSIGSIDAISRHYITYNRPNRAAFGAGAMSSRGGTSARRLWCTVPY